MDDRAGWRRHVGGARTYSIDHPSDWRAVEEGGILVLAAPEDDLALTATSFASPDGQDLDGPRIQAVFDGSVKGLCLIEPPVRYRPKSWEGMEACLVGSEGNGPERRWVVRVEWRRATVIVVTANWDPRARERVLVTLTRILNSLRLDSSISRDPWPDPASLFRGRGPGPSGN